MATPLVLVIKKHFFFFAASNPEEKAKSSKFSVWITCEPNSQVPDYLILNLHKISWNHITMDQVLGYGGADNTGEMSTEGGEPPLAINFKSPQTHLHTGNKDFQVNS